MSNHINLDEDALAACAELVGRTGAKDFQIGYLHDNVPLRLAGWYAYAQYPGNRIGVETTWPDRGCGRAESPAADRREVQPLQGPRGAVRRGRGGLQQPPHRRLGVDRRAGRERPAVPLAAHGTALGPWLRISGDDMTAGQQLFVQFGEADQWILVQEPADSTVAAAYGPFSSVEDAEQALQTLRDSGVSDLDVIALRKVVIGPWPTTKT